jgi:hypothetical protein
MQSNRRLFGLALAAMVLGPQAWATPFEDFYAQWRAWKESPFIAEAARFPGQAGVYLVGKNFGDDPASIQVCFNGQLAAEVSLQNSHLIRAVAPDGLQEPVMAQVFVGARCSQPWAVAAWASDDPARLLINAGTGHRCIWTASYRDRESGTTLAMNYTCGMHNRMVQLAFGLPEN